MTNRSSILEQCRNNVLYATSLVCLGDIAEDILRTELVPFFVDGVSIQIVFDGQGGAGSPSLNDIWQR